MVSQKYRWDFIGLSTDTKPTSETSDKVVNGSTYYCSDTSKLYVYCNGTWYERKPLGGGGGGGTSDFNDLSNRPKYNGSEMTSSTDIPEVKSYTAGTNVSISDQNVISATDTTYTAGTNVSISDQNVISATDTTYSTFTGTDGTAAGVAGLVPAPATTDAGKFLKADGTWGTAAGGSGPTVVQTTGTSTTDVMSQKAVSDAIYLPGHDPVTNPTAPVVALGYYNYVNPSAKGSFTVGTYNGAFTTTRTFDERSINILGGYCIGVGSITIGIGAENTARDSFATVVGASAKTSGNSMGASAFGLSASTGDSANGAVAVGAYSNATAAGEMNIGSTNTSYGYNNSNYRLLTGLYDGQSAHDAATVAQGNTLATSAPTTSTVGVLGQLYTDTTNMHTYQCTAISGDTYTWTQRW